MCRGRYHAYSSITFRHRASKNTCALDIEGHVLLVGHSRVAGSNNSSGCDHHLLQCAVGSVLVRLGFALVVPGRAEAH
jgi:hypothetical protein